MKFATIATLNILLFIGSASNAFAGLITFTDRALFEAQGVIDEFQDFESFDSSIFTFGPDPLIDGSVTYNTGSNVIIGSGTFIAPVSNTFSYDSFGATLQGSIGGNFSMFAFDMAVNGPSGDASVTLTTNVDSYVFNFSLPAVQDEQLFQGWIAESGEFFTGFSFEPLDFVHIDNVTLGTAEIPAPATLGLLGFGLLALRQRRKV